MGKSPEARDDRAMLAGVVEIRALLVAFGEILVELDGSILVVEILAVHEGQVEEASLEAADLSVETTLDGEPCSPACPLILRECPRIVAKQVARELIENDHVTERAPCRQKPWRSPS